MDPRNYWIREGEAEVGMSRELGVKKTQWPYAADRFLREEKTWEVPKRSLQRKDRKHLQEENPPTIGPDAVGLFSSLGGSCLHAAEGNARHDAGGVKVLFRAKGEENGNRSEEWDRRILANPLERAYSFLRRKRRDRARHHKGG